MLKVTLEIDNNTAHSCSPLEFMRDYILQDAKLISFAGTRKSNDYSFDLINPYAKIKITDMEQI